MRKLITQAQAKQITGGRTPNMPVEYENAVRSLQACIDLIDAKYWSDKADALAAWAKIYRSEEATLKAKQLKLHAYRRMAQIAEELRPSSRPIRVGDVGRIKGVCPGSRSLLIESGLKPNQADAAIKLRKISATQFDRLQHRASPPSPTQIARHIQNCSDSWRALSGGASCAVQFRSFCRRWEPKKLAAGLAPDEASKASAIYTELSEWLDAFEQALPKEIPSS